MIAHIWQFFFAPLGHPFYEGNVYGNLVAILPTALLGWVWSKTRFWPLRPVRNGIAALHSKLDTHHKRAEAHNEWMAKHLAAIHEKHVGPVDQHPHFDL